MAEDIEKKLIEYLRNFGNATFLRPNYNPKTLDFAGIELITRANIEKKLIEEINSSLEKIYGQRAFIRDIEWGEIKSGRFRYIIEILPFPCVPINQYEEVTNEVLSQLPKILRNYRIKNHKNDRFSK